MFGENDLRNFTSREFSVGLSISLRTYGPDNAENLSMVPESAWFIHGDWFFIFLFLLSGIHAYTYNTCIDIALYLLPFSLEDCFEDLAVVV